MQRAVLCPIDEFLLMHLEALQIKAPLHYVFNTFLLRHFILMQIAIFNDQSIMFFITVPMLHY